MSDKMLKNLREMIGKIEPSAEFKNRSRRLIFSSSQNQPASFLKPQFKLSFVAGLVSVLIVFAVGGFIFRGLPLNNNTNFNGGELLSEAENLDFNIHLKEAQYFDDSAKEIAAILKELEQPN